MLLRGYHALERLLLESHADAQLPIGVRTAREDLELL